MTNITPQDNGRAPSVLLEAPLRSDRPLRGDCGKASLRRLAPSAGSLCRVPLPFFPFAAFVAVLFEYNRIPGFVKREKLEWQGEFAQNFFDGRRENMVLFKWRSDF